MKGGLPPGSATGYIRKPDFDSVRSYKNRWGFIQRRRRRLSVLVESGTQLISLALVIFKGQEFYVELTDTWAESDFSEFVRSIVLPQLDITNHGCTADEARSAVLNWLGQFSRVEIYTDAPQWDWFLLTVLCGKQGISLHVKLAEVDTEFLEAEACSETPHHALKDARILARMLENSLA